MGFARTLLDDSGKTNYKIITYDGLGHILDLPYFPPTTITNHAFFPKPIQVLMGGDDKLAHTKGQRKLWVDTLQFLRKGLDLKNSIETDSMKEC